MTHTEHTHLKVILDNKLLNTVFQPICHLGAGDFIGYEALIRGPVGSEYEFPHELFAEAAASGLRHELEIAAISQALDDAKLLRVPGYIFINISGMVLINIAQQWGLATLGQWLEQKRKR